jgi:CubicO group peptidase (beta-lactamase class C family)
MRPKLLSFWTLSILLHGWVTGHAGNLGDDEPPLRLSEPLESIVNDLEGCIPHYIAEESIPGLAIALIRDSRIVWMSGFGVSNTITREPVTDETLFEVASNSKVMTAYIALRLVDEGKLELDTPLNDYLPEPWLPPSQYRDVITLRHVLSHSSGLGHNSLSRESLFAPGLGYSYSGMGFLYLQQVIEEITGQPLEDVAQELLFRPLDMNSSSYVNEDERLTSRTASGHMWAAVPALFFLVLFSGSLLFVGLAGIPALRICTGRWRPARRYALGACVIAFVLSLLPPFLLLGRIGLSEFAWIIALSGLGLGAAFITLFLLGRGLAVRSFSSRPGVRKATTALWAVIVLAGLGCLAAGVRNLPVPRWTPVPAGAASSVRATACDMATFLIELSNPRFLSEDTAEQLRTPQVKLAADLSWGLGPGIQHSSQGDALWQWGQHIDFQSVMIVYPEHGFGVVILTNSDLLNPDVAMNLAQRAIGGKIEAIRSGSHTEFDYREAD